MALTLEDKKAIVAQVATVASTAHSAVLADYRGLTVAEITELRTTARSQGVYLRVVRNTLLRRAVEGTEFSCIKEGLTGPLMVAFSRNEPSSAARLIRDFSKSHEKVVVRMVAINGKLLGPKELETVAKLPTRDEAIASLMAVMKAPITKLACTLKEPHAKLVRTIAAIRDQKQTA